MGHSRSLRKHNFDSRHLGLTSAEHAFVRAIARTGNVHAATKEAWPAESTRPTDIGSLIRSPRIARAIGRLRAHAASTERVDLPLLVRETLTIAALDPADLFDAAGNLLPITEMPIHARKAIAGIEVVKRNIDPGDGQTDSVIKVKLWDKTKAIELLGKLTGLLVARQEVGAPGAFSEMSDAQLRLALTEAQAKLDALPATGTPVQDEDPHLSDTERDEDSGL